MLIRYCWAAMVHRRGWYAYSNRQVMAGRSTAVPGHPGYGGLYVDAQCPIRLRAVLDDDATVHGDAMGQ